MNVPAAFLEPVPLPAVPHDDLIAAFMADDPAEFDRLVAAYYPEGEDDL